MHEASSLLGNVPINFLSSTSDLDAVMLATLASSLLCSPLGSTDKRSEVNRLTCSFAQCAEMRASRFGTEPQSSNYPMRKE